MDTSRFDRLIRTLSKEKTRRGTLRLLGGGLVAGLLTRRATESVSAFQLDGSNGWALCGEPNMLVNLWTEAYHCGACDHNCWAEMEGPPGQLIIATSDHGICKSLPG